MSFEAFFATIESPELRTVADHWRAARKTDPMPGWAELDPVQIGRSLRFVWAWKYDRDADTFTGRLAGEEIIRAFGKSPRGKLMSEYFAPEVYRVFFPWQRRVVLEPAFQRGTGAVYSRLGRNFAGERIMMPLADDGLRGDGIIGATFYRPMSAADEAAVRGKDFGAERIEFFPLTDAAPA